MITKHQTVTETIQEFIHKNYYNFMHQWWICIIFVIHVIWSSNIGEKKIQNPHPVHTPHAVAIVTVPLRIILYHLFRFLCCVYFFFCLRLVFCLCSLCCQCIWIVHFWLPLRFSLMFIYKSQQENESNFKKISRIYPIELEIKDTTDTDRSASYLDLNLVIDIEGRLRTELYDKRDHFNFRIVNFPSICSNIPAAPIYGVYISQLIRYSRPSGSYHDFLDSKLLKQSFLLAIEEINSKVSRWLPWIG
jgi:hypothetical protein